MSYVGPIVSIVEHNENFREVVFDGKKSQLVAMTLRPGEDIGEETHEHVEQILYVHSGSGRAVLDGKEHRIKAGDVVVVTPGTRHDLVNDGRESMRIATVYVPANHIKTTVHATKADAIKDESDEAFGESVR